jgi:hypothetical protein
MTPRSTLPLTLAWCLALGLFAGLQQVGDWDTFWHLTLGEQVLRTGAVPRVDGWSWTHAGAPWRYRDLGGALYLGAASLLGGWPGVALARALVVTLALASLWLLPRDPTRPPSSLLIPLVGLTWVTLGGAAWLPRPLLLGSLGWVALLVLLERAHACPRRGAAWWWAAAAVVAVWLQCHRSAVLGVATLGAALVWHLALGLPALRARLVCPIRLSSAALACFTALLAGLATPNGPALYRSALGLTLDPRLRLSISEWTPTTPTLLAEAFPVLTAVCLACGLAVLAAPFVAPDDPCRLRRGGWRILAFGVTTVLAMQAVRHLNFWLLGSTLWALAAWRALPASWQPPPIRPWLPHALLAALCLRLLPAAALHDPGWGPVPDRFPAQALAQAEGWGLGPRVHHAFVFGGWLARESALSTAPSSRHPRWQVWIDGRNETVYPADFYLDTLRAAHDPAAFAALQARWPADWVLGDNTPGRQTHAFLTHDPAWRLVWWDDVATVWVPADRLPEGTEPFVLLQPGDLMGSALAAFSRAAADPGLPAQLQREADRLVLASPRALRPRAVQLMLAELGGDLPAMQCWWASLWHEWPDHPVTRQLVAPPLRPPSSEGLPRWPACSPLPLP